MSRARRAAPSSPRHPLDCRGPNCTAKVWLKTIRRAGDAKPVRLPLDTEPSDAGTIAARPYSSEHGRFLAQGEALEPGEQRWVSHFDTCPDAKDFRHKPGRPEPTLF